MATHTFIASEQESLAVLLYLYVWPFWMFKDVSRGTLLEQAAAYRYNRDQRVYLPGYIARWSVLCLLGLAAVRVIEHMASAGLLVPSIALLLAGVCGVFASWAFVVALQIAVAYVFLCRWQHL